MINDIPCPTCNNTVNLHQHHQEANCLTCGSHFSLTGHYCAACFYYHEEDEVICSLCSSPLSRLCPKCQTSNWPASEFCASCSESLDAVNVIIGHLAHTTAERLRRQMQEAQGLKLLEEEASNKRMNKMMAIEMERQSKISQRLEKQRKQERQLFIVVFAAVAIFLLVLVVYAVVSTPV